jgi:hypothetical protein
MRGIADHAAESLPAGRELEKLGDPGLLSAGSLGEETSATSAS